MSEAVGLAGLSNCDANGWISLPTLPKEAGQYLVTLDQGGVAIARWSGDFWVFWGAGPLGRVIAWRPLPPPARATVSNVMSLADRVKSLEERAETRAVLCVDAHERLEKRISDLEKDVRWPLTTGQRTDRG